MLEIYTDGATSRNGAADAEGGFGVVVVESSKVIAAHAVRSKNTTNNREEMKAIIWALEKFGNRCPVVYSDSAYAVNTFTTWMWNWKRNNWIKSDKKSPENLDLIKLYDMLISMGNNIELKHIKGHVGNYYNEIADKLATGKVSPYDIMKGEK